GLTDRNYIQARSLHDALPISDWETMKHSAEMLDYFKISYETKVVSAHRTPEMMMDYAKQASENGIDIIIAGAGGAAHLPGMVASDRKSTRLNSSHVSISYAVF